MAPRKQPENVVDAEVVGSTAVAVAPPPQSTALAKPKPQFAPGRGKEEIDEDDVYINRIGIAQLTSPQLIEGDPQFVDGLKAGMLFNGITKEIYGKGPVQFAIVKVTKRAGVFDQKGKLVERDVQWDDPRCEWPEDRTQKPSADRIYDFLVVRVVDGNPVEPLAMSLKRTGFKAGKQLNSMMRVAPGDAWNFIYEVKTQPASSNGYNYYVPIFERKGATPDAVKVFAEGLYEAGVQIRDDEAEDTASSRTDDDVPY